MPPIALRAMEVPYSRIRERSEEAVKMEGVVKLNFGESALPIPDFIKQAACLDLEEGMEKLARFLARSRKG